MSALCARALEVRSYECAMLFKQHLHHLTRDESSPWSVVSTEPGL